MFDRKIFDTQYKFFIEHREELVKKYYKRFVVIANQQVVGDYATQGEAIDKTVRTYEPGTFVVQEAVPEHEEKKRRYDPRMIVRQL